MNIARRIVGAGSGFGSTGSCVLDWRLFLVVDASLRGGLLSGVVLAIRGVWCGGRGVVCGWAIGVLLRLAGLGAPPGVGYTVRYKGAYYA